MQINTERHKNKTKQKLLKFDFLRTIFHISLISQSYVEIVANVMQVCDRDPLTKLTTTNSEDRRVTP